MLAESIPQGTIPGRAPSSRFHVPAWRWLAAIILSVVAAVSVARSLDWAEVGSAVDAGLGRPETLALVAVAYTGAFWLRGLAWRLLLNTPVTVRALFANLQTSLFLNHVFPFKAGEISRPLLATRAGVPAPEAVATTVVARLLDMLCLAAIAVAALPAARAGGGVGTSVQAAAGAIILGTAGILLLRRAPHRVMPRLLRARAASVQASLRTIPLARAGAALPLVGASWLLEAAVLLGAASLLGFDVSLQTAAGVTAFTIVFQVVHFTPGGIGTYELAMASALVTQGVPAEQALALAVVTHAMKFAYALTVGASFAAFEGVSLLRGGGGAKAKKAGRFEIVMARLWNVINEGKPFTPVFTLFVLALLMVPHAHSPAAWGDAAVGLAAVVPLALVFWRFDFPLRLRVALWVYLAVLVLLTRAFPAGPVALVLALYLGFTVVLWGTVYYHLRIGTAWTNGFRFVRLVFENPDPTSGNLQEQVPKVLMLVLLFEYCSGGEGSAPLAVAAVFTIAVAVGALLLHQWFFTWVPALPQPRLDHRPRVAGPRKCRRFIAIVIDGCRADRLLEARTPFIDGLRAGGTDYRAMSTVYPARTVTCFSSMLTGASPAVHGMQSNFVPSLGVKCESLFDVLRREGMTGMLVGIAHLIDAFGERDVRSVTAVMHNDEIDDALVERAKRVMVEEDPELLVLQLLSVDQTGHARGSYNAEYLAKIEETDRKVEAFLGWCREEGYLEDATLLITADHGQGIGIGGHGHMSPSEIRIPCILSGAGVEVDRVSDEPRFITDIAPTIASYLGVPAPAASVGRELGPEPEGDRRRPVVFVIPARNEEPRLPAVFAAIADSGVDHRRVVVVDDGSTDGTAKVARSYGALVVSHTQNRGLGAALRTGLAAARSLDPRAVVYLDADGEYDAREARKLLAPIEAGEADYVLGSRFRGDARGMSLSRHMANRTFSVLLSALCGRWISDGQTGFRAFSPRAADVAEIIHDYNYAQVLTLDLLRKGMRLVEVPIQYQARTSGRSFISAGYLWRVPLGMAREMLRA